MATTPKQKAVFDYIKNYIDENGFSPTFGEIAQHFKYKSKGTVYKHIKALKLKGLIRQEWNRVRSIQLASKRKKTASLLPVRGEWLSDGLRWYSPPYILTGIPPDIVHNNNSYLLLVKTSLLNKHHILKGDMVVVQPNTSEHCSGQQIVEHKKGGAALRTPSWKGNPDQIVGQISGVVRKY